MATLINLYNQAGAGPKTLSLNFINVLSRQFLTESFYILVPDYQEYALLQTTNSCITFIKLPRKEKLVDKVWFRLYLEFILIPSLIKQYDIQKLLAFGSFLLTPGKFIKLVLVHHPYLFDNDLLLKSPLNTRIQEYLKRLGFLFTLLNAKHLVVESQYVTDQLKKTWGNRLNKKLIHVLPNPVSENLGGLKESEFASSKSARFTQIADELRILFVSRFYPHKNHQFLIDLSTLLSSLSIKHQIIVTIDEKITEAELFLKNIAAKELPIKNLGEVSQTDLQHVYNSSHIFIFPSKSETFGIPMIEAMAYGLPLVLPKLGYAEAIAGTAGNYYISGDVESCAKVIVETTSHFHLYEQRSNASYAQFRHSPTPDTWVKNYLKTLQSASTHSKDFKK